MGRFGPGSFRPCVVSANLYQNVDCFGQADKQIDRETENDKNRGSGSGQGGCERRIKVFVLKKSGGGGGVLDWGGGGGGGLV